MCGGTTERKMTEYIEQGMVLGKFTADVCIKCDEQYFDSKTVDAIQAKSKAAGLFGMARKAKVGLVGNSLTIRIPKTLAEFLHLKKGQEVVLIPKEKREFLVET
jgi:hypothetical protein